MESLQCNIAKELCDIALSLGAKNAAVISADAVCTDRSFRDICASNGCGIYGKCWTCPPDIGPIDELMANLKSYRWVLVYQTISPLEDSFDFEGMQEAGQNHCNLSLRVRNALKSKLDNALYLSKGGCGVCSVCAKQTGEPCRYPDLAMASLEAYGIAVSRLATAADMKYINGANTVTYFSAVFFNVD